MYDDRETARILVIEDNEPVRRYIVNALESAGFETVAAANGRSAFSSLRNDFFDLVLLDLKLPDVDGLDILKTIRRQDEDIPVVVVSSLQEVETKVLGFDIGCDDFITKPFQVPELIGRVRRLLRRVNLASAGYSPAGSEPTSIREKIEAGPFVIDLREVSVHKNGTEITMRKKLFDLLVVFVRHPGVVISKKTLYERAWGAHDEVSDNSLYVHLHQLRTLIEEDPASPRYLRTVRGVGFVFSPTGR